MGIDPIQYDRVGLSYLEYYAPHRVYHPGVDLNAGPLPGSDFGLPVRTPFWSVVEYVSPPGDNGGFGQFVVLYHPHLKVWTRYAHLSEAYEWLRFKDIPPLAPGTQFGAVGRSGTSSPHLHFEVLTRAGIDRLRTHWRRYGYYPTGLTKNEVRRLFLDPIAWLKETKEPDVAPVIKGFLRRLLERLWRRAASS